MASWAAVADASRYTFYYATSSLSGVTNLNDSGITTVTSLAGASHTMTGLTNDTHGWLDHRTKLWHVASISPAARYQQQPTAISQ